VFNTTSGRQLKQDCCS